MSIINKVIYPYAYFATILFACHGRFVVDLRSYDEGPVMEDFKSFFELLLNLQLKRKSFITGALISEKSHIFFVEPNCGSSILLFRVQYSCTGFSPLVCRYLSSKL